VPVRTARLADEVSTGSGSDRVTGPAISIIAIDFNPVAARLRLNQIANRRPDRRLSHFLRVPFAMKEDVSLDPIDVSGLSPQAVVLAADRLPHLVEQSRFHVLLGMKGHPCLSHWGL